MPKQSLNIPLPILGLDVSKPAEYIDSRATANIKNMAIDRGIIRKRYGTEGLSTSLGERVMGIFELRVGITTRLIRVGLTKVEDYNKTTEVWADIANTPLTGIASENVYYAFPLLSGAKVAVFTNFQDNIRKITTSGNDADLGGTPPKCRYLVSYNGYLVLGYVVDGGNTYYNRIQWSDTGDIETWSGGNSGSVNLVNDEGNVTGLSIWKDYITAHKEQSIYIGALVNTADVFRFDMLATGAGCAEGAGRTIINLPTGEQFFYSKTGFRLFNGSTAPLIPSPIQDELRDSVNPTYVYKAWAILVEEEDEVWCFLPTGVQTEPNTVYKYNYALGQLYKDERTNLTAGGLYENTAAKAWNDLIGTWSDQTWRWNSIINLSLNKLVAFGDSSGAMTRRTASYSDNGTAIDGIWDTKDFTAQDFGVNDLGVLLRWTHLEMWAKGSNVTVYYSTDSGSSWTLYGEVSLSADYPEDSSPLSVWFDVVSSKIRFRFRNNTDQENFSVKKYFIEASRRERRK